MRRAYLDPDNKLRASVLLDPAGKRTNTKDNTPGVVNIKVVPGDKVDVIVDVPNSGVALAVNGIDPFHPLRPALPEKDALGRIFREVRDAMKRQGCKRAVLVGHNSSFDLGFLNAAVARGGIRPGEPRSRRGHARCAPALLARHGGRARAIRYASPRSAAEDGSVADGGGSARQIGRTRYPHR